MVRYMRTRRPKPRRLANQRASSQNCERKGGSFNKRSGSRLVTMVSTVSRWTPRRWMLEIGGGFSQWEFARLREVVEATDRTAILGISRPNDPAIMGSHYGGITLPLRRNGHPYPVSIVNRDLADDPRATGLSAIHELTLHTAPQLRGDPPTLHRHLDPSQGGGGEPGQLSLPDRGALHLNRLIPMAPGDTTDAVTPWNWDPDRVSPSGLLQLRLPE